MSNRGWKSGTKAAEGRRTSGRCAKFGAQENPAGFGLRRPPGFCERDLTINRVQIS
jgi:hypothetical protein